MDADYRHSYADVDDSLFDTTRIPLTTRDIRTVGELLFDVDHLARQLLMDVSDVDAGRLLRAWPAVVTAAADLWSNLPGPQAGAGAHDRDKPITRLVSLADAIENSLRSCRWPPASRPDPHLTQMANTLRQASALVGRYGAEIPIERTEAHRDLEAARARIMHALYVTAHAVGVSLHQYGRIRFQEARDNDRPLKYSRTHSPYAIPPTTEWIRRMAVSEAAAGRYRDGRFAKAFAGEVTQLVQDETRISRALAGWDIQAHRALAGERWPANMLLITRTQGLIAGAALVLVDAAHLAGKLDVSHRLTPAIVEAGRAWSNLASRWSDLTPPNARLDPNLMRAAAEVRAAYRELTHNATTLASPDVIATRCGLKTATTATLHALESGSDLAYVVAEKADSPGLTGPARALSIRAHSDIESSLVSPDPDGDVVWISPAEILARQIVRAPRPVVEGLCIASALTVESCNRASAVSNCHAVMWELGSTRDANRSLAPQNSAQMLPGASVATNHPLAR